MGRVRWPVVAGVLLAVSMATLIVVSTTNVTAGLWSVFGSRLGRVKPSASGVDFEVSGAVTDRQLFRSLLAVHVSRPGEGTLTVNAVLPDEGWAIRGLAWERQTGRLSRWGGQGGEPMVKTYPPGVHVAFASSLFPDGVTPYRVDAAALARLATGIDRAEWADSWP